MKCDSCGAEIAPSSKFCPNCGTKVSGERFCPACGTKVSASAKFCFSCGARLTGEVQVGGGTQQVEVKPNIAAELWCPHCNSQFFVPKGDEEKENVYWNCPSCGGRIDVAFCGYCDQHYGYVAFRPYNNKEILGATILGGIIGYNNPEATIGNLVNDFFDSTPKASASGVCPKCQAEFVKCPFCHRAVHITFEDGGVVVCPDCHTKFKMN